MKNYGIYSDLTKQDPLSTLKTFADEHKRFATNCDCEKKWNCDKLLGLDHKFSWDQKKVLDRGSRSISRKIKEAIHFLKKNLNYINRILYYASRK